MTKSYVLPPEQQYVQEIAVSLGMDIRLVAHSRATNTCVEKRKLLNEHHLGKNNSDRWTDDRIIKACYFHPINADYFIGVVASGPTRLDLGYLLSQVPFLENSQVSTRTAVAPEGMAFGTCTPFSYDFLLKRIDQKGFIKAMLVCDVPCLDNLMVDASIGGVDDDARKKSIHLPYGGIFDILKQMCPDKVYRVLSKRPSVDEGLEEMHVFD